MRTLTLLLLFVTLSAHAQEATSAQAQLPERIAKQLEVLRKFPVSVDLNGDPLTDNGAPVSLTLDDLIEHTNAINRHMGNLKQEGNGHEKKFMECADTLDAAQRKKLGCDQFAYKPKLTHHAYRSNQIKVLHRLNEIVASHGETYRFVESTSREKHPAIILRVEMNDGTYDLELTQTHFKREVWHTMGKGHL